MTEQRPITQIDELTHNQAMLTLTAERRELLSSRIRIAELEQLARGQVALLEEATKRIEGLESELLEAQSRIEQLENTLVEKSE